MRSGHAPGLRFPRGTAPRGRRLALWAFGVAVVTIAIMLWPRAAAKVEDVGAASAITSRAPGDADGLLPQLAAHLETHPRDARAWAIYARLRAARGQFGEASAAYARAVELPGKVARDPLVWCEYADALALSGGGRLAGRPRELIDHALALDSRHPRALEMAGSAEIEQGNFAAALRYWEELLAVLPADSPAQRELAIAVERTRMRAGR